jgi:hypothetical protein
VWEWDRLESLWPPCRSPDRVSTARARLLVAKATVGVVSAAGLGGPLVVWTALLLLISLLFDLNLLSEAEGGMVCERSCSCYCCSNIGGRNGVDCGKRESGKGR